MYAACAAVSAVMQAVLCQFRENMPSMRRVTAKPPKMLMLASRIATNAMLGDQRVAVPDLQQRADDDDARRSRW